MAAWGKAIGHNDGVSVLHQFPGPAHGRAARTGPEPAAIVHDHDRGEWPRPVWFQYRCGDLLYSPLAAVVVSVRLDVAATQPPDKRKQRTRAVRALRIITSGKRLNVLRKRHTEAAGRRRSARWEGWAAWSQGLSASSNSCRTAKQSDYAVCLFLFFASSFSWFSLTRAFTILLINVYGMGLSSGNLKLPFSPS